ncbi:MAG: alpha/beta hydrolase-fold protein, partial [Jatrophihabitantaceae bacterium]
MALTGAPTVCLAVLALLASSTLLLVGWSQLRRLRWGCWPARLSLLAASQCCAVVLVALLVNDQFAFYQNWAELLGSHPRQGQPAIAEGQQDARLHGLLLANFHAGRGTLVSMPVPGVRSKVHAAPATVYLPPQYGDPAMANRSFPVVELLSGFPGGPASWLRDLHVRQLLDSMIKHGQSAPFIAVIPVQNVASPRDTECVNVLGGPQVDSYLSYDVRTATARAFRASAAGSQWTVLGYSTGGYCAVDLSLRHPGMFSAAVSLAGYNAPAHDRSTGSLFGHRPWLARAFSPIWLVEHGKLAPQHVLLVATKADPVSLYEARQLAGQNRSPVQMSVLALPRGGHNFATFAAELPTGIGWLSRYVATPLAPIPTVDGRSPHQV